MKYIAKGNQNRHFELRDTVGELKGNLDYTSWFSRRSADVQVPGASYTIAPTGTLQTTIALKSGEDPLITGKFNWKGQIVLHTPDGHSYVLKRTSVFGGTFGLFNDEEREIMVLHQHFEIKGWSFCYEIDTDESHREYKDIPLILMLLYCINHMHLGAYAPTM